MLGAYGSAAAIIVGSLIVGQAVLTLCGRERWSWLAPGVGLATVLIVADVAIRVGGHADFAAVALLVLALAGLAVLIRRRPAGLVDFVALAIPVALLTIVIASLPFAITGRVGILGVGLVNDDMASHLVMANWLLDRAGDSPRLLDFGYPYGPHAVAGALSKGFGTSLVGSFAGLTLAVPPLAALASLAVLERLPPLRSIAAAIVVALPYLITAYLAQGAFKEPILALLVLTFALLLAEWRPGRSSGVPLGLVAAGAVYTYSFPGLFWIVGALVAWLVLEPIVRSRAGSGFRANGPRWEWSIRALAPPLVVALVVLAVATIPDWTRMVEFAGFRAFGSPPAGHNNLTSPISPLEGLGIWASGEFRLAPGDSSLPAALFYLGALAGAVALAYGLVWWLRRRLTAVPAALGAAAVIYACAAAFGSAYTSAKALAIAAPLVLLVALRALLAPRAEPGWTPSRRLLPLALGALVCGLAAVSSFLVLRQAPVGPPDHADELAALRPKVQGRKVLFLGRDDFIAYELRGARIYTPLGSYFLRDHGVREVARRPGPAKFDFDAVKPSVLRRFRYVIIPNSDATSLPPPSLRPDGVQPAYTLYKRTGQLGPREILAEGAAPGAKLNCTTPAGRRVLRGGGTATVWQHPPVLRPASAWSPKAELAPGATASQTLKLRGGRWYLGLQYDSQLPLTLTAAGRKFRLPGNLDYRGTSPYFPAGRATSKNGGKVSVEIRVDRGNWISRLLGGGHEAHLRALAAAPVHRYTDVPIRAACGHYVDWYRPAASGKQAR